MVWETISTGRAPSRNGKDTILEIYDGAYPLSPPDPAQMGKQGDRIGPGESFTYHWSCPHRSASGVWLFHDHSMAHGRSDALGAIGIARAFAYGGYHQREIHNPGIAPVSHESFEAYRDSESTTINHFYEKLLLLAGQMNTGAARRLAAGRHSYMRTFLERFQNEWEGES